MPYHRHPDADRVYACPECDHAGNVYERTDSGPVDWNFNDRYRCTECGVTFDDPVEREAREWTPGRADGEESWQHHRENVLRKHGLEEYV